MPTSVHFKDNRAYLIVIIIIAIFIVGMEGLGLLDGLDRHFYDLCFRIRGNRDPGQRIIIAAIDEKTLSELGRWPLPRKQYAALLDHLKPAACVAFDILMPEPSEDDALLADAISRHGKVVLPVHIDTAGRSVLPAVFPDKTVIGHVHVGLGIDGITRDVFHSISVQNGFLPSLARAIQQRLTLPPRSVGDGEIPCDPGILQRDPMMINFYGPAGSFQLISFSEILKDKWPASFFEDRIILVGVTADGIAEGFLSPFTTNRNRIQGIETHATILSNLLNASAIRPVPEWIRSTAAILLAAALLLVFRHRPPLLVFIMWIGSIFFVAQTTFLQFSIANRWFPPSILWAAATGSFMAMFTLDIRSLYRSVIQARREWEESFNTINDAIIIQDPLGNRIRENEAAHAILDNLPADILFKRFSDLSSRCQAEKAAVSEYRQHDMIVEPEEIFGIKGGRFYEIKSLPRVDGSGRFQGAIHLVRDITQRKKVQVAQEDLQKKLLQAQKMEAIGTLAGGIAHDFNNILGTIVGYTELVWNSLSPEQEAARAKLEQVLKASERARDLIMQIFTFSRNTPQKRQIILLRPILREGLKLFRRTLPKSITVRENISSDCRSEIDPTQLYQILMNLCTNAYHSMKEKGGELSISLEAVNLSAPLSAHGQELAAGFYALLRVKDSGRGISPETGENIFEPYFTTKAVGEGTGLGLAIVRRIAQDHGGLVTFESILGEGTVFSVYLPRADEPPAELREPPADTAVTPGTGHILLIDDNPQMALLVKQMLEGIGYQVETRLNPIEALDAFKARPHQFDLVMTDLDMPGMTGLELTEKLLMIRTDIPILLSTGYCEPATRENAIAMGIKGILLKPFHVSTVSRIISKVLTENSSRA